jgi:hypothetical protein
MNDLDELDKPDDGGPGRTGRRSRWARRGAWALALLLVPTALAVPLANAFDPTAEDVPASAPLAPVGLQAPTNLQSPDAAELNAKAAAAKAAEAAQASEPGFMSPYSAAAAQADPNAAAAAPSVTPTASPTPTATPTPEGAPTETGTLAPTDDQMQPPIPGSIVLGALLNAGLNALMAETGSPQGPQDQASQPEFMDPNSAAAATPAATPTAPPTPAVAVPTSENLEPASGEVGIGSSSEIWRAAIEHALAPFWAGRLRDTAEQQVQGPDAAELNANLSTPARRDLAEAKAALADAEARLTDAQLEPAKADVGQAVSNFELARQEYSEAQLDLAVDEARRKRAAQDPGRCGFDGARCNYLADAAWPVDKRIHRFGRQLERTLDGIEDALKGLLNVEPGANP